jgi:hypothetical protein
MNRKSSTWPLAQVSARSPIPTNRFGGADDGNRRMEPVQGATEMSTTASPPHLPALGSDQRDQAGHQLRTTLVELIDLSLLAAASSSNSCG